MTRTRHFTRNGVRPGLRTAGAVATIVSCSFLAACSQDDSPTGPPLDEEVARYLASLPSWAEFVPPVADARASLDRERERRFYHSDTELETYESICTTTPYTLIRTPNVVVPHAFDQTPYWLGSLYDGASFRDDAPHIRDLNDPPRAPLTLRFDLLGDGASRTVDSPTEATVDAAIVSLRSEAIAAGHTPQDVVFNQTAAFSIPQALLDLGLSERFIDLLRSPTSDSTMSTVVATYFQPMFTTSIELPRTPAGLFSEAFTAQQLDALVLAGRIGPDNPPVYVSDIGWGRMVIAAFSSRAPHEELQAALQASFEGTLSDEQIQLLGGSAFDVESVGGGERPIGEIRNGTIAEWFRTEYASLEDARPVFHTFRSLADGSIAGVSEAVTYDDRACITEPVTAFGGRYSITLDKLELIEDGCDFGDSTAEVYYNFEVVVGGETILTANRSASNAVGLRKGGVLEIDLDNTFNLNAVDSRVTINGTAFDADPGSDHRFGTWDLGYNFPISLNNEGRFFTRPDAGSCRIRFHLQFDLLRYFYS